MYFWYICGEEGDLRVLLFRHLLLSSIIFLNFWLRLIKYFGKCTPLKCRAPFTFTKWTQPSNYHQDHNLEHFQYPRNHLCIPLLLYAQSWTLICHQRLLMLVSEIYKNNILYIVLFCVCLFWVNIMSVRVIQVNAYCRVGPFALLWHFHCVDMPHFIHSTVGRHLSCSLFLAIMHHAVISILVHVFWYSCECTSVGHLPGRGIAGSSKTEILRYLF